MRITNPTNATPINSADNATTPPLRSRTRHPAFRPLPPRRTRLLLLPRAYSLVPSFELQSLNALLQQVPPVREDVVAETIQRLASGQLRPPMPSIRRRTPSLEFDPLAASCHDHAKPQADRQHRLLRFFRLSRLHALHRFGLSCRDVKSRTYTFRQQVLHVKLDKTGQPR